MSRQSYRRCDPRFYEAFDGTRGTVRAAPLNTALLLKETEEGLQKVANLASYRGFLAQARSLKAARRGTSMDLEGEVLAQAKRALKDAQELAGSALRMIKHLKNVGVVDQALDSWKHGVEAAGIIQLQDVWEDVLADKNAREAIDQIVGDQDLLGEVTKIFEQLEATASVQNGNLTIEAKPAQCEGVERVVVSRRPPPGRAETVTQLLAQGRFDAVAEVFDQPGVAVLDVVQTRNDRATVDPIDAALAGAVVLTQELARHVRKLEDTGLATYQGDDPATVITIVIVGGVLMTLIGIALMEEYCTPYGTGSGWGCTVGQLLVILGLILFGLGTCAGTGTAGCVWAVAIAVTAGGAIFEQ